MVDLRMRTDEEFRTRYAVEAKKEKLTYEEFLEKLLDFRADHMEQWKAYRNPEGVRRSAGGDKK